ncbi:iron-containing redox enzyme family protein [Stutzerimonas azotifigens]|uniref:iron-containing redox enzyme family protein n=1 Tax=Stutzerimonas azotifigens TaxID=291995 RepID=UPI0004150DFE|nr:iron-containing redox enzyme family protein [Stutzerimonas azotifigens]
MQLTSASSLPLRSQPAVPATEEPSKALYFALNAAAPDASGLARAADYLETRLDAAASLPCDLPDDPAALADWAMAHTAEVGRQYQAYLEARRAGAPRRYFGSRAHALHFLQGVAPTKLVDGAWLYGLLQRWDDPRFGGLIQTYLEELGEGIPEKNHVVLYRRLLAAHGCEDWQSLDDEHFVQGAVQLALAHQAERFLPELIGYNLGYEQLPLHLLISSYELTELGIDPYYFTLHVTVDNADTGHAKKAVQALEAAWPQVGDRAEFYRRVKAGYRLNELGASTLSVIAGFDPEQEVLRVLERKRAVGRFVHSDYIRFAGRTVNQWLADPALLPEFLATLEQRGWIRRHRDPQESRFWQLIQGEQAEMFGVFSAHEQQLIHDWIAGDWAPAPEADGAALRGAPLPQRPSAFQGRRRLLDNRGRRAPTTAERLPRPQSDFDAELRQFERELAALPTRPEKMRRLLPLLSPADHHTPLGLMATRIFTRLLY